MMQCTTTKPTLAGMHSRCVTTVLATVVATGALCGRDAAAATVYLDLNGTTSGFGSGSGSWGGSVWSTNSAGTATPGAWNNNSPYADVVFKPSGTVSIGLGAIRNVNSIDLSPGSGRTLTVSPGYEIALKGAGISVSTGSTLVIQPQLSGTVGLTKSGGGKLTLDNSVTTGANSYTGATLISGGTIQLDSSNQIPDASALTVNGAGARLYVNGVSDTITSIAVTQGTLGGRGTLTVTGAAGVSLASGSLLDPAGTLAFDLGTRTLNLSGAVSAANSKSLAFDLVAADAVSITNAASTLAIGSDTLEFDDFNFVLPTGLSSSTTFTLFDTARTISGTLGANLTGTIGGYNATIAMANNNQDITLTVSVPEPSLAMAATAGMSLLACCRRRRA